MLQPRASLMRSNPLWPPLIMLGLLLATAMNAQAQPVDEPEIVLGTAAEGRAYWTLGQRFKAVADRRQLSVEVLATEGSVANLRRLADASDPMNLGLTQADAMQYLIGEQPQVGEQTEVVESIGLECVFAIAAADNGIASEQDWQRARAPRVAIQAADSGVAITHRFMGQLVPELADDEQVYMDLSDAVDALHAEGDGRVDVVFQVHRPKHLTAQTRAAIDAPQRYRIIPLEDPRLKAIMANGETVYEHLDLPLVRGLREGSVIVPTLCTRGLLVSAPAKLGGAVRTKLQTVLDYDWMMIYPEER